MRIGMAAVDVNQDPGEQASMVAALAEMEQKFRVFSETSVQGKLILKAFRPLWANAKAARILGFDDMQALMHRLSILSLMDAQTRADPTGVEAAAMRGLTEGQAEWRRLDGTAITVAYASRPIRWSGQDALMVAFTDISEMIAARREANAAVARWQAALTARRDMLRCVSHHMRTPLHALMGRVALAQHEDMSPMARQLMREALSEARRMLVDIDDILDRDAVETGAPHLTAEVFDLADAVDDALQVAAAGSGGGPLPVHVRAPLPGEARVRGDRRRLMRVALALLEVGLARRSADRWITFSVTASAQSVDLAVTADAPIVLDGAPAAQSRALDLAAALAQAMGGRVHVDQSVAPGFRASASLPFARLADPAPSGGAQQRARPPRVLAVDDHPGNLRLIGKMLETLGCVAFLAGDGRSALAMLSAHPFDLVLMDIMMPGLDGLETTRLIRIAEAPWSSVAVAALTADASDETRAKAEAVGMDAVLTKPLDPRQLAEVIAMLTPEAPSADALDQRPQHPDAQPPANDTPHKSYGGRVAPSWKAL